MAWKIRKHIQGRHLRAKYRDIVQAYVHLLEAYKEATATLAGQGQLVKPATMEQIAKVAIGEVK